MIQKNLMKYQVSQMCQYSNDHGTFQTFLISLFSTLTQYGWYWAITRKKWNSLMNTRVPLVKGAFVSPWQFDIDTQHRQHQNQTLQWRHNGRDSVSNHQPQDCLLNRQFRRRSKKTSKLRVTGLCVGNSPGEFPTQRASDAENVSIWWCHHETPTISPHSTLVYTHQYSLHINAIFRGESSGHRWIPF